MQNAFQCFSIPSGPWINPDVLRARFHALASISHPDVANHASTTDEPVSNFSQINEAWKILSDPILRIQHLIQNELPKDLTVPSTNAIPKRLAPFFAVVANLLQTISNLREKLQKTQSNITKALLHTQLEESKNSITSTLTQLDELWIQCEGQLQSAQLNWETRTNELWINLTTICSEMAYLQKWRSQLREAKLFLEQQL